MLHLSQEWISCANYIEDFFNVVPADFSFGSEPHCESDYVCQWCLIYLIWLLCFEVFFFFFFFFFFLFFFFPYGSQVSNRMPSRMMRAVCLLTWPMAWRVATTIMPRYLMISTRPWTLAPVCLPPISAFHLLLIHYYSFLTDLYILYFILFLYLIV
jgi:hypothetical protein